jgi:hypothetical protein
VREKFYEARVIISAPFVRFFVRLKNIVVDQSVDTLYFFK